MSAVPVLGRSYQPFILALTVWIAIVFAGAAVLTRATPARVRRALAGSAVAALVNLVLDVMAHHFGWWRYPEASTPFGPLAYYAAAGLGFGALALITVRVHRRYGPRTFVVVVAALAVYGPLRDHRTSDLVGLIEFRSGFGIVVADAVFEWLVPYAVAVAITFLGQPSGASAGQVSSTSA